MASYNIENDSIGGYPALGAGFGGGGYGLLIILLLFFAIFMGGGGLFGCRREGRDHDILDDVSGRGPSNCNIEKEVIKGNAAVIENQNCIYEKQQAQMLTDAKLKISQLETEKCIEKNIMQSNYGLQEQLNWIKYHMAQKPPEYATTFVPTGCTIPCNLGERFERRDRDRDCCFC